MNNYHTHTYRCMHATGQDEDFVKMAISAGFKELGFSDHTPWPYENYVAYMRMPIVSLEEYIASINELKELYKNQISIKVGLECEYFPAYMPWLKQLKKDCKLDYLLLGIHYYPTDENTRYMHHKELDDTSLDNYHKACIDGMKTGLFECLAHPDLFLRFVNQMSEKHREISEDIIKTAKKLNVILEYNLNCLQEKEYRNKNFNNPNDEFWAMVADYKASAIIGYDAHNPQFLTNNDIYDESLKKLKTMGIRLKKSLWGY